MQKNYEPYAIFKRPDREALQSLNSDRPVQLEARTNQRKILQKTFSVTGCLLHNHYD